MITIINENEEIKPIPTEVSKSSVDNEEIDKIYFTSNIIDIIKNQNNSLWDIINELNSVIATLRYNENEKGKIESQEDIINILNGVIDDLTINLGMLNKAESLIDIKGTDLLLKGMNKAEEIINDKNTLN